MVAASELASRQGRFKLGRKRDKVTVCSGESRDQASKNTQRVKEGEAGEAQERDTRG